MTDRAKTGVAVAVGVLAVGAVGAVIIVEARKGSTTPPPSASGSSGTPAPALVLRGASLSVGG